MAIGKELDQAFLANKRLQSGWRYARRKITGVRKSDTIFLAIDAIALCGLNSPARLGRLIEVTTKRASQVLEELHDLKAICEVTKKRTHKLYGLPEFDSILNHSAGPRKRRLWNIPYSVPDDTSDFQVHMSRDKVKALHEDTEKIEPATPADFKHFYEEIDNANRKALAAILAFSKG